MSNIITLVLHFPNQVIQPANSLYIKLNRRGRNLNIPNSIRLLQEKYELLLNIQTETPVTYLRFIPQKPNCRIKSTRLMGV
jgi:hypothetical protein